MPCTTPRRETWWTNTDGALDLALPDPRILSGAPEDALLVGGSCAVVWSHARSQPRLVWRGGRPDSGCVCIGEPQRTKTPPHPSTGLGLFHLFVSPSAGSPSRRTRRYMPILRNDRPCAGEAIGEVSPASSPRGVGVLVCLSAEVRILLPVRPRIHRPRGAKDGPEGIRMGPRLRDSFPGSYLSD